MVRVFLLFVFFAGIGVLLLARGVAGIPEKDETDSTGPSPTIRSHPFPYLAPEIRIADTTGQPRGKNPT